MSEEKNKAPEGEYNLPPMDVYSLLKSFIGMLGMHTWHWIGLVKNPETDKLEKDLVQAKVAIDTMELLEKQLAGKMTPEEESDLRGMLSNLQLNYVQQKNKD